MFSIAEHGTYVDIQLISVYLVPLSLCSKMVDEISTGGEDNRVLQVLSIHVVVVSCLGVLQQI